MGYKLAGIDVLGGVEIDPRMSKIYVTNHQPKYEYLESIVDFVARDDASLPPELFDLDIFDGSPPCSTFSSAGLGKKAWGKDKKFREGQATQVLDSLPMVWAACALKLRPRVAIMENVTGMAKGDAKGFIREVVQALSKGGYDAQIFNLNASLMGVPQKRQRIFIIARRRDLELDPLRLAFNEPTISTRQATEGLERKGRPLGPAAARVWKNCFPGEPNFKDANVKGSFFNYVKLHPDKPANTLTATGCLTWWHAPEYVDGLCAARLQSFPDDYDYGGEQTHYVCGMSVPPLMTQRIAIELRHQWLDKLRR